MRDESSINPGPLDRELFLAVLEQPVADRAAFLAAQCGDDAARRERVAALLAEHQVEDSFLETPAVVRSAESASTAGGTQVLSTNAQFIGVEPGERIGRYKLLQQIGEGGCGTVYMAEQEHPVRRRVALKIIKLGMDTKGVIARFEAERQALAMMDHPNIAKVLDAGATETGRPYFVMELVRGIKITEYADQNNLPTEERLKLFIQVCNAIQHAHQKGIIHRDIKPSNILVTLHDGVPVPKVIDFGIAKAIEQKLTDKTLFTQFQAFIGTPAYMSPEQAEMSGLDIDTRSDIYSLGVLLYEILTGQTPFDPEALISNGIDACRRTIREQEPARPSTRLATMLAADLTTTAQQRRTEAARLIHLLRGDLDWIVMKCLEKDRTRRYESASGLAADVQRYLANEAVLARPPSNVYRLKKLLRKHRGPVAAAAGIAATLIIGAGASIWLAIRATEAEREAIAQAVTVREYARELEQENQARRLNEYIVDISLAQQSLRDGNYGKAVQLLAKHLPAAGEEDLRGFEWRYLWEVSQGDEHERLPTQESSILSLAVSPEGRWLVTGVREQLLVWDLPARSLVTTLTPREGSVTVPGPGTRGGRGGWGLPGFIATAFSPGDGLLLAGSRGSVRQWSVDGWTERPPLPDSFGYFAVSPADGRVAVSRGRPGRVDQVAVLAGPEWEPVREFPGFRPLAFSRDGRQLAWITPEGLAVARLDRESAPVRLHGSTNLLGGGVSGWLSDRLAAFTPDGGQLVAPHNALSERGVFVLGVWDTATGEEAGVLPESPDQLEHTGVISAVAISPDGRLVATGSMDHSIRLWELETRRRVATLQGHLNEIWTLAFTPDGAHLISGAKDGSLKLWATHRETRRPVIPGVVEPLAFSPDGRTLAALTREGGVAWLNLATGDTLREIPLAIGRPRFGPGGGFGPIGPVMSADLRTLVHAPPGGMVNVVNTETGTTNLWRAAGKELGLLALSPNGRTLVTAARDEMPRWWDLRAGTNTLWSVETVRAVFSPDGRWIATVHPEGAIQVWSAADRAPRATLAGEEILTGREDLVFSPDGRKLAAAYGDHTIGLWDVERGEWQGRFTGHKQPVRSLAFSADGRTLASAGADSTLRLWNVATQQELLVERRLGANWRDLRFSPDGQLLVGGGGPESEGLRYFRAPVVSAAELESRSAAAQARVQ